MVWACERKEWNLDGKQDIRVQELGWYWHIKRIDKTKVVEWMQEVSMKNTGYEDNIDYERIWWMIARNSVVYEMYITNKSRRIVLGGMYKVWLTSHCPPCQIWMVGLMRWGSEPHLCVRDEHCSEAQSGPGHQWITTSTLDCEGLSAVKKRYQIFVVL